MKLHVPVAALSFALSVVSFAHAQTAASPAPETNAPAATTAAQSPAASAAAQPNSFQISGTVRSGKTPLPGVTVTAANTLTGKKFSVATAANGTYSFTGLPRGRYVVRVEFMAFAPQTQEVILKPETPSGKFDAELILASRQPEQSSVTSAIAAIAGGRGFQSLAVESTLSSLAGGTLGALLASWSLRAIPHMTAFHLPRAGEVHLDWVVLGFAAALLGMGTRTVIASVA